VVSEERIELNALFKVLDSFETADVFKEIEVAVCVDAGAYKSVPVDALQLDVCVVLLELEIKCLTKVDVRALDRVHVFTRHFKLVEVKIFREYLHLNNYYDNNFIQVNYSVRF